MEAVGSVEVAGETVIKLKASHPRLATHREQLPHGGGGGTSAADTQRHRGKP